jgi:hypothetical protein
MSEILDDVLFEILSRMTPAEVINLSVVCKQWHQIATSDAVWEKMCRLTFGDMENEGESWMETFRRLSTLWECPLLFLDLLLIRWHSLQLR